MQPRVMVSEMIHLKVLNRLQNLRRKQSRVIVDAGQILERVKKRRGACAEKRRSFTGNDRSVIQLDGNSRSAGFLCLLKGCRYGLSVFLTDARLLHQKFNLINRFLVRAVLAALAKRVVITADNLLPRSQTGRLVVNDAVSCHINAHVGRGLVRRRAENPLEHRI